MFIGGLDYDNLGWVMDLSGKLGTRLWDDAEILISNLLQYGYSNRNFHVSLGPVLANLHQLSENINLLLCLRKNHS